MVDQQDEGSPEGVAGHEIRPEEVAGHEIRPLASDQELQACVALQREVWGPGFSECVPVALLKVTQRLGGTLLGAFDREGRLDGFVFGLTGVVEGRTVHWSDMLAVRAGVRDQGLGMALKAGQREALLTAGITLCHWTFDPLESRNAWLNLARLGALVREYVPDMYGSTDSPLHQGIGTDRFVVHWPLDSERVRARVEGSADPPALADHEGLPRAFDVHSAGELPAPGEPVELAGAERFLVPIPRSIQEVKVRDPDLAVRWRHATRGVLLPALGVGFQVSELLTGGQLGYYLLERPAGGEGAPW